MKQRFLALILLILLLLLPLCLLLAGFLLPAQYSETFVGVLPDKLERLHHAPKKRLIFVGGSSVPFSLRSDLIEASFPDYTVVDFGLYAQLGTPVMLDLLQDALAPGDIVIISPEQDSQALSLEYSPETLWQAIDGHFDLLLSLPSHRYGQLAAAFASFAGKKCQYALTGAPSPTDIYARSSFNAYGDIDSPLLEANIMPGGYDPNQMIRFRREMISQDFISYLNDFNAHASQIGASVYYRFPPMNQSAIDCGKKQVDAYYDDLNRLLDFSILGDPNRSILECGWFYDTNFHLNASGAVVFTKTLIQDLKILMHDTSVTDIPLPAIPALSGPQVITGDNTHRDYFTYRKTDNGWIVSGLTEQGQRMQQLIVPVSREELPVVGMDASVFIGNTQLKEVTIQENIGILYDGMFRGCAGLQKLILTGSTPASYTVGDGLTEGADFLIYVPEEALDSFRRHYTWQQYGSYILPLSP